MSETPRRKVDAEELKARLAAHKLWLESEHKAGAQFVSGEDEDLSGAELLGANLSGTNLSKANLSGAFLRHANLSVAKLVSANLSVADLWAANLSGANLSEANLSGAHLSEANLSVADLWAANLSGAHLRYANLSGADLRRAVLDNADVRDAELLGVGGLYGRDRATGLATVKEAEWADYGHRRDYAHWAFLRFIGTLRIFAASYAGFIGITAYVSGVRWYNEHVGRWHQWAAEHGDGPVKHWAALVAKVPALPVQTHFGWMLAAIGLLVIASTLFAVFCPEPIKEATETRWTRELNQPLIEYRSAMYAGLWWRYICLICFVVGGGYTAYYIVWNGIAAIWFLLHP